MAIVNMKKMHLLGLKKEQSDILGALQKTGVVEVVDVVDDDHEPDSEVQDSQIQSELTKKLSDLEAKLSELKFGIDFLGPYVKTINPLIHGKPAIKKSKLTNVLSHEEQIFEKLQVVFDLDKRNSQLKVEESKLHNQIEMLTPWSSLDIPLEQLGETHKAVFVTTVMSRKVSEELEKRLVEDGLLAEIKTLGESQDDVFSLVIYHKNNKGDIENLFKEFSVSIQIFQD